MAQDAEVIERPFITGDHVEAAPGFGYVIVPSQEASREPHGDDDVFVAWEHGGESWIPQDLLTRRARWA